MDTASFETFDIDVPEEFRGKIQEGMTVLYWEVGIRLMKGLT
jgi:translation elongation factor P/translation initiation factor 5A